MTSAIVHKTPLPYPPSGSCDPQPFPNRLTDDDRIAAFRTVLDHFSREDFLVELDEGAPEDELRTGLTDVEKMFMSKECMLRALTADSWDAEKAILRLEKTLVWRRSYGVYDIDAMAEEIQPDAECGKCILFSYTRNGSPILSFTPSRNTTDQTERSVKNAVFMVERAVDLMVAGVEQAVLVMDLGGNVQRKPGAIGIWRQQITIMDSHYFERMNHSYVQNVSFLTRVLVTLIWPFVDPVTKNKVTFDVLLGTEEATADKAIIPEQFGGLINFERDYPVYWPEMMRLCKQRRDASYGKWKQAGGTVGMSEMDFKVTREEAEKMVAL